MGSYLDKPETTKKSVVEENDILQIGASSMQVIFLRISEKRSYLISSLCVFQGWRINQEVRKSNI